jgi:hypothetical protein
MGVFEDILTKSRVPVQYKTYQYQEIEEKYKAKLGGVKE